MVRFPLHNEIEEIRVVETGIRKETVSCKEGDIESNALYQLYKIHLSLEEMKELTNEMSKYFGVPVPDVTYSMEKPMDEKTGRPINGRYLYPTWCLIFYSGCETAGLFVHEFAHHLQYLTFPNVPSPEEHGLLFHYFEKLILQSEIFWRTLEKMGKVKSVVCTLTKEGEEYMRKLGILP
jgi:hypothetical protein